MIRFLIGKPGGGKTMQGTRVIWEELVNGTREVVTNDPLVLEELNALIQEQRPDLAVNLFERVRMLSDDEVKEFYLYRQRGAIVTKATNKDDEIRLRWSGVVKPVLYVIDEVHVYFNARQWMKVGLEAFFYLSQHRGLGDDVYLITQHPQNVDRQFRSVAEDYFYIENLGNKRTWGITLPKMFLWRQYMDMPGPSSKAVEMGRFKIDVTGLARCYKTQQKIGLPGTGTADIGRRPKGVPWWVAGAALLIGITVAGTGMDKGLAWLSGTFVPGVKDAPTVPRVAMPGPSAMPAQSNPPAARPPAPVDPAGSAPQISAAPTVSRPAGDPVDASKDEPEVFITGLTFMRGKWTVFYSDGSDEKLGWSAVFDQGRFVVITRRPGMVERYRWQPASQKGQGAGAGQSGGSLGSPTVVRPRPGLPGFRVAEQGEEIGAD